MVLTVGDTKVSRREGFTYSGTYLPVGSLPLSVYEPAQQPVVSENSLGGGSA